MIIKKKSLKCFLTASRGDSAVT